MVCIVARAFVYDEVLLAEAEAELRRCPCFRYQDKETVRGPFLDPVVLEGTFRSSFQRVKKGIEGTFCSSFQRVMTSFSRFVS